MWKRSNIFQSNNWPTAEARLATTRRILELMQRHIPGTANPIPNQDRFVVSCRSRSETQKVPHMKKLKPVSKSPLQET